MITRASRSVCAAQNWYGQLLRLASGVFYICCARTPCERTAYLIGASRILGLERLCSFCQTAVQPGKVDAAFSLTKHCRAKSTYEHMAGIHMHHIYGQALLQSLCFVSCAVPVRLLQLSSCNAMFAWRTRHCRVCSSETRREKSSVNRPSSSVAIHQLAKVDESKLHLPPALSS